MLSLMILLWILPSINAGRAEDPNGILPSINAGGQEDHFQAVHDAVSKMWQDQYDTIIQPIDEIYWDEIRAETRDIASPANVVVLQKTNNSVYILDTRGYLLPKVQATPIGFLLSDFMSMSYTGFDLEHATPTDEEVLWIAGDLCYHYNLTLAERDSGPIIEAVGYDECDGSTLRSYFMGKSSELSHLKEIWLWAAQVTELTVTDLIDFPELQTLYLDGSPITFMENGLLCHNLNLTVMSYTGSGPRGSLTVFPRQIFNCTMPLKLENFRLRWHNIALLPAHAFGSAAEQLRDLYLNRTGLEVIHKDAFTGLINLQHVHIYDNNLLQLSGAMIPPSARLKVIDYTDNRLNGTLNLTRMHIASKSNLLWFEWEMPHISIVEGSFCSNQSKSELAMIVLRGINPENSNSELDKVHSSGNTNVGETLPANVFAHCISLKYLKIKDTRLTCLPDRLFSTNVSQLETLLLARNKLNSNTSWSEVLRPLHKLKNLDLSKNMLTSWTHNLSSLWSLQTLDLSHNSIAEISHVSFMNVSRLTFLSLENNNIAHLTPEVQHAFARIPQLNLASNNIHKLNMLNETMLSDTFIVKLNRWNEPVLIDTVIVDISSNSLVQLDMPLERKCSPSCSKISLYGDNNKLPQFVLPCSSTHQYATVSLTNNNLTEFSSIFPDVFVQQCSIETLNVSGNYFKHWIITHQTTQYEYAMDRLRLHKKPQTHNIDRLDMTRCGINFIDPVVFYIFNIQVLDIQMNAISVLPVHPDSPHPHPRVIHAHFNPVMCDCKHSWLKQYLTNETLDAEKHVHMTHCIEPVWNKSIEIITAPAMMFMCDTVCPQQIHQECDKTDRCYKTDSNTSLGTVVCLSSYSNTKLSNAYTTILYRLYVSGFNLSTLQLPYVKPHSLMHLNLTSCNISVIPETTFINTPRLELLVLAHNTIQTIPSATFHPLVWLEYLDLSNNQLLSFDASISPLFLLNTVFLHKNKMKQLSVETLCEFKILDTLSLQDNPWICSCNDTFGPWIVEQQRKDIVLNPENITCDGTDTPVMYSNVSCNTHTLKHVHHGSKTATVVLSVLASLLGVTLIVCILIYKYRHTLSVLAYIYIPLSSRKRAENDNVRGVFAICDDKEMGARIWIKDSLIPFIESACPLLWSERTFIIGDDMADNIQYSVEQTNCAIVLLSRRFLQNEWSCCMFQAAFSEMRERKRPYKIILILTPDVTVNMLTSDENCPQDLRVMLKTQRLVYMSERFYYETLLYLLPESCRSTRQIMTVRGEDNYYHYILSPTAHTKYGDNAIKTMFH